MSVPRLTHQQFREFAATATPDDLRRAWQSGAIDGLHLRRHYLTHRELVVRVEDFLEDVSGTTDQPAGVLAQPIESKP